MQTEHLQGGREGGKHTLRERGAGEGERRETEREEGERK